MFKTVDEMATPFYSRTSILACVHMHVLFNSRHPNGYQVLSQYGFHFHFCMTNDVESFFIYLLVISVSSLEKCLSKSFDNSKKKMITLGMYLN